MLVSPASQTNSEHRTELCVFLVTKPSSYCSFHLSRGCFVAFGRSSCYAEKNLRHETEIHFTCVFCQTFDTGNLAIGKLCVRNHYQQVCFSLIISLRTLKAVLVVRTLISCRSVVSSVRWTHYGGVTRHSVPSQAPTPLHCEFINLEYYVYFIISSAWPCCTMQMIGIFSS